MTKKTHILFVGTVPPPYHGQAIAFSTAYRLMDGTKYLVNQNFETKPIYTKVFFLLFSFLKIWYYLLFKKIDIVYFACSRSTLGSIKDIFLVYSTKLFGLPIVNHLHGARMKVFMDKLPSFYRRVISNVYSQIDTSIVLLDSMKNEFHQFWPKMNVQVIANFYSEEFNSIRQQKQHANINIVYLSNIIYSKGILDLLDAFIDLSSEQEDVKLIIAGDFMGDEYYSQKEIEKLFLKKLEKLPNASYIGVINGMDKVNLLATSDIFVLPTFYSMEAFPLSIVEAMRTGNIIVTTNHNYLPEIVTTDIGYIVPPSSPKEISSTLNNIISNPTQMEMTQKYNISYAINHYNVEQYIQHLNIVMKETLQQ